MGLIQDKDKLQKALEENKETLALEVIMEEAKKLNERLKSEQKECLCLLNDIQIDRDDQLMIEDQMDEIMDQYHKSNDDFDRIIH